MNYDNKMDEECIRLCDAMNTLPGIHTNESCCGHKEKPFKIWFEAESLKDLSPLLYYFNPCHSGFDGWSITAHIADYGMPPHFCLRGPVGAYEEGEAIARLLEEIVRRSPTKQKCNA